MQSQTQYDVIIIGGGLAGLSLSIQVARAGYTVALLEKESYPFHRVCGEYISLESWDFLRQLDIDLPALQVPVIKQLQVSGKNGKLLQQTLPLGGFGISRFLLDASLASIARKEGVVLVENTKVNDIVFDGSFFSVYTSQQTYKSRIAAGSFGKRSNIDVKWKRAFITATKNKLNNYVGVKYHIRTNFPTDTIALHTFPGGYCGIVKIEDDRFNLCYLTTADNLQKSNGSIQQMEEKILSRNPHLKKIFSSAEKCTAEPVTISQISFDKKSQVENHVLLVGDAAGMITPLCGNGMSMALHGSKLAAQQIILFLEAKIDRIKMEQDYILSWQNQFAGRLRMGRAIQKISGNASLMNMLITCGRLFPFITRWIIRRTHGNPF